MLTTTLVSGNLLFAEKVNLPASAKIRLLLLDITAGKVALEQELPFDAKLLAIFKYLPFQFKNFELLDGHQYEMKAHVDLLGDKQLKVGDFVSTDKFEIKYGLEEFDIAVTKVD